MKKPRRRKSESHFFLLVVVVRFGDQSSLEAKNAVLPSLAHAASRRPQRRLLPRGTVFFHRVQRRRGRQRVEERRASEKLAYFIVGGDFDVGDDDR